jgi:hypothetical protein
LAVLEIIPTAVTLICLTILILPLKTIGEHDNEHYTQSHIHGIALAAAGSDGKTLREHLYNHQKR